MSLRRIAASSAASLLLSLVAVSASAQTAAQPKVSVAAEADVIAYALPGYSAIVSATFPNKLQAAFGIGRYDVPSFLLKGDDNYDAMKWKATSTSVQVARVTYRFKGAMKSGLAIGAVALRQNWRLESERVAGKSNFVQLNAGVTAGYYFHIGEHFYLYPTTALTYNRVLSGDASLGGMKYTVAKFAPNAALHAGWEWGVR